MNFSKKAIASTIVAALLAGSAGMAFADEAKGSTEVKKDASTGDLTKVQTGNDADGFWPMPDRIIPLCQENMYQNLMMAHLTLGYAEAKNVSSAIVGFSYPVCVEE